MCQKQVADIEKHLKQAKESSAGAKDIPTIEVIHRLCDLAKVLDHLKSQEECLVASDCAIRRAVEFQRRGADNLARRQRKYIHITSVSPLHPGYLYMRCLCGNEWLIPQPSAWNSYTECLSYALRAGRPHHRAHKM